MARPSKYYTHVQPKLDLIKGWASDGLTDEQIRKNLDLSNETYYRYKKEFPEFSEALKNGKEKADYIVQNALFNSAIGFAYYEEGITNTGEVRTVQKFCKPNVTAQVFWLKNRCPNKWRDKTEVTQDITQTVLFSGEDELND